MIKTEVNVKEIKLLDDASGILVKRIKPNFKVLGPRFGKDMKLITAAVNNLDQNDIQKIEREGKISLEIENKSIILQLEDVEISSQDIEGWLVASTGSLTVALDITIDEELKQEGIARELVNRIQNLRKDSGFEVTDKIGYLLLKKGIIDDEILEQALELKQEDQTKKKRNLAQILVQELKFDHDTIFSEVAVLYAFKELNIH